MSKLLGLDNLIEQIETISNSPTKSSASLSLNDARGRAGAKLLLRYQQQWASLHATTEQNAVQADVVARKIQEVSKEVSNRAEKVVEFESLLSVITSSKSVLEEIQENLQKCFERVRILEEVYLEREKRASEESMKKYFDVDYHVKIYEGKKNRDYKFVETKLKRDHEARIKESRRREEEMLKERQEAFNEAFESELSEFKQKGKINRPLTSVASTSSIKDVYIEPDEESKKRLQKFLEDEDD